MNKVYIVLLAFILIFYLFTRLFQIDSLPASLYWDEASIGYNAYSILKTDKDEWNQFLPLHFKAFGEYKLPFYIYIVSLFELIFGLNILAVRIPSVLFGLGVVYLTYLLSLRFYKNNTVAILSAFIITISSWFFIFSRTGYEAVAGLFWFMMMIYAWFKSKEKNSFLLLVATSFALSIYSYNSYRIISPLFLLFIIFDLIKSNLIKNKLLILVFFLLIFLSVIPIASFYITNKGDSRLNAVGILDRDKKTSQIVLYFTKNYLSHFNPIFLLKGDGNLRNQQPNFGPLYIIDLLFLLISIIYIVKEKNKNQPFPLVIVLLSFIPSALTKEAPHSLRSLSAAPFVCMLVANGVIILSNFIKTLKQNIIPSKSSFYIVILFVYLVFFSNFFYNFIKKYQLVSYDYWQYQYKKLYDIYSGKFNDYDNIIISDRYNQPYIFTLFYLKIDPEKFNTDVKYNQSIRKVTSLVANFDKFTFNNIDFYNFPKGKDLIFAHPNERLTEIPYNDVIVNPDGSIAFYVYYYTKK